MGIMPNIQKGIELRPCPFCGRKQGPNYFQHNKKCYIRDMRLKKWNSAFCWEELSRKDELLREAIEVITGGHEYILRGPRESEKKFLEKAKLEVGQNE